MDVPVSAPLAHRVAPNANTAQIADAVVANWHEIDAVLVPIIGKRGLAALYQRSVHVTAQSHPWLSVSHEGTLAVADFTELIPLIRQQDSATAMAGAATLFTTFHQLLSSVVGSSLTERLLGSVWADSPNIDPEKDINT
jgi:hypothetical protein